MKSYSYRPRGTCSSRIDVCLEGDTICEVCFTGGCSGNTQGIERLVRGMKTEEAIARLKGIRCGMRPTSCPDQLAQALQACLEQSEENN